MFVCFQGSVRRNCDFISIIGTSDFSSPEPKTLGELIGSAVVFVVCRRRLTSTLSNDICSEATGPI